MKRFQQSVLPFLCAFLTLVTLVFTLAFSHTQAEVNNNTGVKISDIPTQEDTSVLIKKGSSSLTPDFEIISGTGEIVGDPSMSPKEAYANWKSACDAWKKETRELNIDNQVLVLNCNMPTLKESENGKVYHSSASYRLRVQIRNGPKKGLHSKQNLPGHAPTSMKAKA